MSAPYQKLLRNLFRYEMIGMLVLIVVAILMRLFSFFPSELDHDESTYTIIGNELLKGKMLYRDVTDTKPLGIFLVYAGLQYLFGYSIFMRRLFAAVIVGLTAFFVRKVALRLFNDQRSATVAPFLYLIYTSAWLHYGLSPNTELYFNLCTIVALLFFLDGKPQSYFYAGIAGGIGFMFKYLVLLDFVAFGLFFLFIAIRNQQLNLHRVFSFLLAGIGFVLPFGLSALWYYWKGEFDEFYFISFVVPGNYGQTASFLPYLAMIGDFIGRFFPLSLIALIGFRYGVNWQKGHLKVLFSMWILMVVVAMYLPGKGYLHYSIQLMLPFSLLGGAAFNRTLQLKGINNLLINGQWYKWALPMVLLVIQLFSFHENYRYYDHQRQVASYLKQELNENERVFITNYEPIVYYLLRQDPPGKYIHSNIVFTDLHKAFEFDNRQEIERIMNTHPKFVIVQDVNELMDPYLNANYNLDTLFRGNRIKVYRRN